MKRSIFRNCNTRTCFLALAFPVFLCCPGRVSAMVACPLMMDYDNEPSLQVRPPRRVPAFKPPAYRFEYLPALWLAWTSPGTAQYFGPIIFIRPQFKTT